MTIFFLCIRKILFVAQIIPPHGAFICAQIIIYEYTDAKKIVFCRQIITKIPRRCQLGMLFHYATNLKNVEPGIYEYVHCKKGTIFFKLTTW
jgi:hypothetical protein